MDIHSALQSFGLSDKESKIYIELLPLGTVKLQDIAKRAGYPRSTVYHTLNYLTNKGLVAKIIRDNVTYYTATDPNELKAQLKEKEHLIDSILPSLHSLKLSSKEPSSVEIYEGFNGVQTILSDLVKVRQQVYYFGGYGNSLSTLKHLPNYTRIQRIEKKIHSKIVYDPVDEPILHTKEYQEFSELRFLDEFKDFPCMIFVYGDKVSMFSHKTDLVGIIIKNKDFAEAMKRIFYTYFDRAKSPKFKIDKKYKELNK